MVEKRGAFQYLRKFLFEFHRARQSESVSDLIRETLRRYTA